MSGEKFFESKGVYIEEVPDGADAIVGLPTDVAAFIGTAVSGAFYQPTRLLNFAQFTQAFGTFSASSQLPFAVHLFFLNGGQRAWALRIPSRPRAANWRRALRALDAIDSFNVLVLPGLTAPAVMRDAIKYCEKHRAFAVLDPPGKAKSPAQILDWANAAKLPPSSNAAIYYPWIKIVDPSPGGAPRSLGPSGAVAGIYARTDLKRGVWKAPAGTDAVIAGIAGLERGISDTENGELNRQAINSLRSFSNPACVWGARTLAGRDPLSSEFKYVPVRRTALFLEASIDQGTRWAIFEPNDEPSWARVRLQVGNFLDGLWRAGAFQGARPQDAWFVKCDRTTMTQDDIDNGTLNIELGFAPLRPGEFVIIKLQQRAGQVRK
jgi:phage tail sheath protein FI